MAMAWKQLLSKGTTLSRTTYSMPGFSRFFSQSSSYILKVGLPEFLNGVGRGVETHVTKLESDIGDFQKLLVTRRLNLKKLGIPCKHHPKFGIQTEFSRSHSNGGRMVKLLHRNSWSVLLQSGIRCITTTDHSVESVSQDFTASEPDVMSRIKFKRPDKTARHIMQILDKEAVGEVRAQREILDIKPGYTVQLKVEVPENKRRTQILKGIVIARRNAGLNTTFRIRRLVAGVGVESVFPLYSPNIKEMKVLSKKKVRRAKLYYLRDRMNALNK